MKQQENKFKNQKPEDGYHDDCPICQAMKERGVKMQWYPDENDGDEKNIFESGFQAAKLNKEQVEKLKDALKQAKDQGAIMGGEWLEEDK